MSWWAIDVRTTPSRREWLSAWLVARTGQAVEEREDGTLVTFAPDEGAADAIGFDRPRTAVAISEAHDVDAVRGDERDFLSAIIELIRTRLIILANGCDSRISHGKGSIAPRDDRVSAGRNRGVRKRVI